MKAYLYCVVLPLELVALCTAVLVGAALEVMAGPIDFFDGVVYGMAIAQIPVLLNILTAYMADQDRKRATERIRRRS